MIGVDLVSVSEFRRQVALGGENFLHKAFGEAELGDLRASRLAGLWAAKEAVVKAASVTTIKMSDVRVRRDDAGRTYGDVGGHRFEVSIAHHGEYVMAVALAVGP